MTQDIAKYIKIVGKDNLKKYLKENLKIELHRAISNENWQLVKEVTELLEIICNKNNFENERVLIKSTEIVGISKLNLQLKNFLNTSIEGEQLYRDRNIVHYFIIVSQKTFTGCIVQNLPLRRIIRMQLVLLPR
ncbi:MAG: hypothetical protein AAFW67_02715 [Cyanobacteria bacterium J06638_38]